ncbi:hypothetical protein IU510_13080 [Nocardia cyriacigeorgica]|nr:hypothetical protein [Nocardia cyriacigeorgica]MBF6099009.1 hypothetical protein [Nocardia cyriacigeorgica]MBF6159436.1 hypothetical protein [Nocardia cyriacigeorgica]MBF6198519.1 hypothetical protein [Nocardia cyriacigeorgica]MBF6315808.1 hypothetical protein [Nocardia cyriacigeorgica]MBF6530593.1 hypothetical protein [Nocardia cyriacigeorgica]
MPMVPERLLRLLRPLGLLCRLELLSVLGLAALLLLLSAGRFEELA